MKIKIQEFYLITSIGTVCSHSMSSIEPEIDQICLHFQVTDENDSEKPSKCAMHSLYEKQTHKYRTTTKLQCKSWPIIRMMKWNVTRRDSRESVKELFDICFIYSDILCSEKNRFAVDILLLNSRCKKRIMINNFFVFHYWNRELQDIIE